MMLPNAWIIGQTDLLKRFLNCMNLSYIPMVATIASTLAHVLLLRVFVFKLDWGITGLTIANTITNGS